MKKILFSLLVFLSASSFAQSPQQLQSQCDSNFYPACLLLGVKFFEGDGVQQNKPIALRLLGKGCDGGAFLGCQMLGNLYATGDGIRRDMVKAAELFKRSCDEASSIRSIK
jgi:TPR repeat protein